MSNKTRSKIFFKQETAFGVGRPSPLKNVSLSLVRNEPRFSARIPVAEFAKAGGRPLVGMGLNIEGYRLVLTSVKRVRGVDLVPCYDITAH